MPDNEDNETNDNTNKRPKRSAAKRTSFLYENPSVWSEDKDLKRALLASLQDVKRTASKTTNGCDQNQKKSTNKKNNRNDINSKSNGQSMDCKDNQPLVVDNNCSLLSLAAHRRARVSAQRKFAQSSGFSTNSPVSTPIKAGFVSSSNAVELFPNQKPNTEDFLTFLCLRRSPILPPNLDFIRLNNDKKRESDSEMISGDELEANDKYTTCRITASANRRGSASSVVSKSTSLSSRASLQISNNKKYERIDNKSQQKPKRIQSSSYENGLKNVGLNPIQSSNQSQLKKNSMKSNDSKEMDYKTIDCLKQKYKQQRIDKKSSNPSKSVVQKNNLKDIKENKSKDKKNPEIKGIQTRLQLRNHSFNHSIEVKEVVKTKDKSKPKNSNSGLSGRVLRSHHSHHSLHSSHTSPKTTKVVNNLLVRNSNTKKTKSCLNSSQIGIRPKKRKAKPVVPLIDYYFDSEFESDSDKRVYNKIETKTQLNSNEIKAKNNLKTESKDNKKTSKPKPNERETRSPGRPKGSTKTANKSKTSLTSEPRRLTRSSRPLSPPKNTEDLERERLIKQQIIAIERKHKRLRRCPSDQSLHSSSSSSSSSSESLPNSLSSSSSINNTRLTRSLEHLKKIRDIAAKLKREQNRKKVNKNKTQSEDKKHVLKTNRKTIIKHNFNKRQNVVKTKRTEICVKDMKMNNKIEKTTRSSKERAITRRMSESLMSASTSDTDCDITEGEYEDREDIISEMNGTEDSMASILDEDMERASIVIQDMAEDINSLLVSSSEPDLQYGSTEHIQGLMTSQFGQGAFSDETITTASAILLPSDCHSEYSYVPNDETQRLTVDASTNTTEDDILSCLSSDETDNDIKYEYNSKTTVDSEVQTDGIIE